MDRIFALLKERDKKKNTPELAREVDVYIMAFGGKEFEGLLHERMRLACQLWDACLRAEFAPKVKPRPQQQFSTSEGAPVAVILGQDEVEAGQVRVKGLHVGDRNAAQKDKGQLVPRENLVEEVRKLLAATTLEQE